MRAQDCQTIERELGVELPDAYRDFQLNRSNCSVDSTTVADDTRFVIERTLEYRQGYAGAPPWPGDVIYVGDEDDACPYALVCPTGRVIQTDHGSLNAKPLSAHPDFESFVESLQTRDKEEEEAEPGDRQKRPWWRPWR